MLKRLIAISVVLLVIAGLLAWQLYVSAARFNAGNDLSKLQPAKDLKKQVGLEDRINLSDTAEVDRWGDGPGLACDAGKENGRLGAVFRRLVRAGGEAQQYCRGEDWGDAPHRLVHP